jgi:hypothetical protein
MKSFDDTVSRSLFYFGNVGFENEYDSAIYAFVSS